MKEKLLILIYLLFLIITIKNQNLPLHQLKLPQGLKVRLHSRVKNARQMSLSPAGNLYVGSMGDGNVSVVKNGTKEVITLLKGLTLPVGIKHF
jgi:hypothetical protein